MNDPNEVRPSQSGMKTSVTKKKPKPFGFAPHQIRIATASTNGVAAIARIVALAYANMDFSAKSARSVE